MPQFRETRIVPHREELLYGIVEDVALYPEFLPWALKSKVYNNQALSFEADLTVGFGPMNQTYTSRVHRLHDNKAKILKVEYLKGPFSKLENEWQFKPLCPGNPPQTEVSFFIDFEFSSFLLGRAFQPFFEEAVKRMITAFEERARSLS
jgi:coenzyme Q-binding protein COQ10